jgi:hypothetical protein
MKRYTPFIISSTILILIVIIELASILKINSGIFVYTLDDAYIHLSMAENIANFGYGINLGEFSSCCSSIICPILLAPFTIFTFVTIIPLVLNFLSTLGTLYLSWKIFELVFENSPRKIFINSVLLSFLIPATGMVGLIFSGMEHSFQVFSVVLVLYAIVLELRGSFNPGLMIFSIGLASVIRYENLSVCLFALAFFFVRGRRRYSVYGFVFVAILHTVFALFLFHNGSSFLPASVLLKTNSLHTSLFSISKFVNTITTYFGGLYFSISVFLLGYYFFNYKKNVYGVLGFGCAFVMLLHLTIGFTQSVGDFSTDQSYFFRYEMYQWTFALLTLAIIGKRMIQKLAQYSPILFILFFASAEMYFCARTNNIVLTIPTASNNIYEQQYQNHRLVSELYKKSVAVNDIGYVSFQNDSYVLDLWGLASKEIWKLRISNPLKTEWMDSVVTLKGIELAIIYDVWFPFVPHAWTKIAELTLTKKQITASENVVAYYATQKETVDDVKRTLRAFQKILPDSSMLMIYDASAAAVTSPATNSIPAHK